MERAQIYKDVARLEGLCYRERLDRYDFTRWSAGGHEIILEKCIK